MFSVSLVMQLFWIFDFLIFWVFFILKMSVMSVRNYITWKSFGIHKTGNSYRTVGTAPGVSKMCAEIQWNILLSLLQFWKFLEMAPVPKLATIWLTVAPFTKFNKNVSVTGLISKTWSLWSWLWLWNVLCRLQNASMSVAQLHPSFPEYFSFSVGITIHRNI